MATAEAAPIVTPSPVHGSALRDFCIRATGPVVIVLGAALLRLIAGVGYANYDTVYALTWGQQLSRGETPSYGIPVAPTPHPLIEALGLVLSPLGPHGAQTVTVILGFLALSACGWFIYRLGSAWFGRGVGALAALILMTRVPVLSYGVRAYVDLPYLLLVLWALLVEARRPRAGAPVLGLLALAGLLRPEAWAFSGLYWVYLTGWRPRWVADWGSRHGRSAAPGTPSEVPGTRSGATGIPSAAPPLTRPELARLALLGLSAPLAWVLSDLLVTGDPLWSLTNTRTTAHTLARPTGIAKAPIYIPRRIGEILRPPVLLGAALGGVLALLWLPRRARQAAAVGVIAVLVLGLFATAGLPIDTRYAFLAAAILCVFCGVGVFGWQYLPAGDRRRGPWMIAGAVIVLALVAYIPSQYRTLHREFGNLSGQHAIENELTGLAKDHWLPASCGALGVPNYRAVPLVALTLSVSPAKVISAAERAPITRGTYVAESPGQVRADVRLASSEPQPENPPAPAGFKLVHSTRSWLVYQRCQG
jgi:hypothetical protein